LYHHLEPLPPGQHVEALLHIRQGQVVADRGLHEQARFGDELQGAPEMVRREVMTATTSSLRWMAVF
jgi:hypothetical protein